MTSDASSSTTRQKSVRPGSLAVVLGVWGFFPAGLIALGLFDLARGGFDTTHAASAQGMALGAACWGALGLLALIPPTRRALATRGALLFSFAMAPALLLFSAVELGCGVWVRHKYPIQHTYTTDRVAAPSLAGFPWVREIGELGAKSQYPYAPFRLWKYGALRSGLINVDGDGIRTTVQSPARGLPPFRVQIYGGSTVFCLEVPDDQTLPSCLGRALAARMPDRDIIVENLGVPSYVRAQEAIWFERHLLESKEPPPDLVIFYDGTNDMVFSGWMQLPHRDPERFTGVMAGEQVTLAGLAGKLFYKYSNLGVLLDIHRKFPKPDPGATPEEVAARAKNAAARYCGQAALIRQIAAARGMKTAFFLQPSLYGKPAPAPYEESFTYYERYIRAGIFDLDRAFRAEVVRLEAAAATGDSFDLSHLFDARADAVYLDMMHLGPHENATVAESIAAAVSAEPAAQP